MIAIRVRALETVETIRDSYWFVPGLLALLGFLAGIGLVWLDARIGDEWLGRYEWFYGTRPDGARQILATIASSTITVAGVVFSITLAAVTYASGQYGPRLLSNFIRDRGNQATLGIFVGTFLYCLVVLRNVRTAQEASADTSESVRDAFVPHVAMFGALALAIASISVLIYFVHHVTLGIHINNVIARIGQQLIGDVRSRFRASVDNGGDAESRPRNLVPLSPVAASKTGYIEAIDEGVLLGIARRNGVVLHLVRRPGDFVHKGRAVILIETGEPLGSDLIDSCNAGFAVGDRRTALQDLRFAIDELVEIAARALSPGVNDPFTAMACIDWLGAAMSELGKAEMPGDLVRDEDGAVRIVAQRLRFEDYLACAFGQLRPYAAADPNARAHVAAVLAEVAEDLRGTGRDILIVAEQAQLLEEGSRVSLGDSA